MLPQSPAGKGFESVTPGGISPPEVIATLDKVVASPAFGRVERPARFLRHLVETTLAGESDRLKESVLGVEVFSRPASWDPRLDAVVRQEAARLRKRLTRYYETEGARDSIRIDLPVGGYVPVFSRAFQAIEPSEAVDARPVDPPPASQYGRLGWSIAAFALGGAALFAGGHYVRDMLQEQRPTPSIAVLPLTNLSADPANQYFTEGLTDEITDLLSRNKTLRVAARSSAARFHGKSGDIRDVGRELNVANVLEGSVERSGDRVRIVAHLERVSDGSHLWSNTYERQTADLFAVQTELAQAIADNLKAAAGAQGPARHIPPADAHEAYMKGRYELQQLTPDSLTRAESDFQHAIDLDPAYGAAYFALGSAKFDRVSAALNDRSEAERRSAEDAYRKAAALEPAMPGPHAALANLAMQYDWDWRTAEREFQQALAGPPNASADTLYASFLTFHGRFKEADAYMERAQDVDPFGSATLYNIAALRFYEGRFGAASDTSRKVLSVAPGMIGPRLVMGLSTIMDGHPDVALASFQTVEAQFPPVQIAEAMARARLGQREEALRLIRPYEAKFPNTGVPRQWFALFYALLGDETNTVKWLERSAERREMQVLNVAVNPVFRSMQDSPGFHALKKRMGLEP